jgi:hypothetical protein
MNRLGFEPHKASSPDGNWVFYPETRGVLRCFQNTLKILGQGQKGHEDASSLTGQNVESSAGGAVVHGFDPNPIPNQALQKAGGWKLDSLAAAKNDQLWLEG